MAKKTWNNPISKDVDWGGDVIKTEGLPVSGEMIQKFIKDEFENKFGYLYTDRENNRYLIFADEANCNKYFEDTVENADLLLGTFDAPFNYTAEITLNTPTYNAISLGSTGNYLDFTFDIKNKQNTSTGESVIITYTFIRNANKQVVTETGKYGEVIHFNIDEYLLEGTNNVIIGIMGQSSLAATTVAITYQVVNLSLSDSTDISKVYDLSSGNQTLSVPYSVSGEGRKVIEWYLDGEMLDFVQTEDEITEYSRERVKHITLSNLASGVHNLQFRAYSVVGSEQFYTDILYREILINNGDLTNTLVAVEAIVPNSVGIITDENPFLLYGIEQYLPYKLTFAVSKTSDVEIKLGENTLTTLTASSGAEVEYTINSSISGNSTLSFIIGTDSREINTSISNTTLSIGEINEELEFDFRAVGMSNSSTNRDDWWYNNYGGTFSGFKWNNLSGWVENSLLINEGAKFSINYAPLAADATSTGKTLEFEFAARNVEDDDAVICDLRNSDGTGILITASEAKLISKVGKVVYTKFKSGELNRISFVINKSANVTNKGLVFIYINGILSGAINYGSADNYISNKEISFEGTASSQVNLYSVRIYNTALTSSQILNNYILYRSELNEMRTIYDRNNIIEENRISMDKARKRLPVMVITGDVLDLDEKSDTDYYITVNIDYYNDQDPDKNFKIDGARMRIQGTSSRFYPRKNYRFYTNKADYTVLYDSKGNVVSDGLYAFKDNAQPVDCWCLKADFAESSGTHNTGVARIWNEVMTNASFEHTNSLGETVSGYPLRTGAQVAAKLSGYNKDVRTTIDGFPILVFRRATETDELVFLGKYNFNNDKSTPSVFGFCDIPGFDNSKMQSWEFLENEDVIALFQTADGFYDETVDDKGETKARWELAFEARYEGPEASIDDLYNFVSWMVSMNGNPTTFATEKWQHLDVYKVAAYYCYLMRFGALDQVVKNCFITSEDGVHYYFINYDNDTILGVDNTGEISALPDVNRSSQYENGSYVYAGHESVLWNMLENDAEFMNIVKIVDTALYSAGLTYKNVISMFNEKQSDKWVERVYNEDAQYKYISPFADDNISYLSSLQGSRKSHRTWWLSKRFSLYDSLYTSGDFTAKAVEIKCQQGTPSGMEIELTAGTEMNYGYGINRVPREAGVNLAVNDSHTFTIDTELGIGTPVAIYAGPNIKALDLSSFGQYMNTLNISNVYDENFGTKLKVLTLGDGVSENINVNAISGINAAKRLQELDIRGFKGITELDLTNQNELKILKASNSGLTSVEFAKGSPVERVELPSTMLSLEFEQLPYLSIDNLIFDGDLSRIEKISIKECPKLSNDFDFIYNWYTNKITEDKNATLTMDNIDWKDVDPDKLIEITNIGNLNLKGTIVLSSVTLEQVNVLVEIFGEESFKKGSDLLISAPSAIFVSGKTEILEGSTEKYSCIVFGGELRRITWSIYSGGNSYTTIDAETGLLTVNEGAGSRTITIRTVAVTDTGSKTTDTVVTIKARVYPNSSQTLIVGEKRLESTKQSYSLAYTINNITGSMDFEWSLTNMDGYAEIESSNGDSCVIKKLAEATTLISGTLSCKVKMKYNNSTIFTVTKSIELINETIAETDTGIVTAFYNAGLCANSTYITKDEAALITDVDLQPGTSYSTALFYSQRNNIKSFDGFKYFTGLVTVPKYCFYSCDKLTSINLPDNITSIEYNSFYLCSKLTSINIPHKVTDVKEEAFSNCTSIKNIYGGSGITTIARSSFNFINKNVIIENKATFGLFIANYSVGSLLTGIETYLLGSKTFTLSSSEYFDDMTNTRTLTLSYTGGVENLTDKLKICYRTLNITSNISDAQFQISYNNVNGEQITETVSVGRYLLNLTPKTQVTVTPSEIENYISSEKTVTMLNPSNGAIMDYTEKVDLYIQHIDGNLYTSTEWTAGGYTSDNANGVAVVRPISGNFVIAKEDVSTSKLAWGCDNKLITDIVTTDDYKSGALDNAGINNTPKIIEQLDGCTDSQGITGAPAAEACANYVFPNGNTGYLGALGEWNAAYYNKTEIVNLMSQIGGTAINVAQYWSSTQRKSYGSWNLNWYLIGQTSDYKNYTHYVRAFSAICPFTINCNRSDIEFEVTYTPFKKETTKTVTLKPGIHTTILPELNTEVTISVKSGYEWAEMDMNTQTVTYTGGPISVSFVSSVEPGIFIQHKNSTLYTTEEWTAGGYTGDNANGVALIDSNCAFVIAKEDASTSKLSWGGYNKTITDIVITTNSSQVVLDNAGFSNTTKIIEQLDGYTDSKGITGAPAAEACANYVFPNGNTGYLGALGEWYAVYNNKTAIVEAMSLIGGTAITSNYYWTSTQFSSLNSWFLVWGNGNMGNIYKNYTYYVRAFSAL